MFLASLVAILATACATKAPQFVKTQVVTYPEGAVVEYNGKYLGRAPAAVVLPQDKDGRLTQKVVVRAVPNTKQPELYAQTRVFEPTNRFDRVPDRVMIDMRQQGTNSVASEMEETTHVEHASKSSSSDRSSSRKIPYVDRGKPTQAVGISRWNPGNY